MNCRILGNIPCPSWLLDQICENFSNMTVIKFKHFCIRGSNFALTGHDKPILADTSEEEIGNHDEANLIGEWLLLKPAGNGCSPEELEKEVVQLGLPTEHAVQLRKVYETHRQELKERVKNSVHREHHAEILGSTPNSITFQSGAEIYDVSIDGNMMNQLRNDIENSMRKVNNLNETLPNSSN